MLQESISGTRTINSVLRAEERADLTRVLLLRVPVAPSQLPLVGSDTQV